jgi:hypothetical protein
MLTLSDIGRITNSYDANIYSDLYKDVYGTRPRSVSFASVEEFDADFKYLCKEHDLQIEEEASRQAANFVEFQAHVLEVQKTVNCDRERAIEIIAEAEGMSKEDFDFYGLGMLEHKFDIKYGSIIKWVSEES